jgi:hypothetical protein
MTSPYILALLAVFPFLRAVRGEFLFDDVNLFLDGGPLGIVYRSVRQFRGDYRAMVHLFDSWLWRLFGKGGTGKNEAGTEITQPAWSWHALSLAFHVGATFTVWEIAGWFLEPWRAFVAAAIFAVHPLQVQAVAYISGRAGVQAFFFAALGLIHAHAGGYHWAAVPVCVYFAYKSKQDGLLYLALYPVVLWKTL